MEHGRGDGGRALAEDREEDAGAGWRDDAGSVDGAGADADAAELPGR